MRQITVCLYLVSGLLTACTIGDGPPPGQAENPDRAVNGFHPPPPRLYPGDVPDLLNTLTGEEAKTWQLVSRSENGEEVPTGCHADNRIVLWRSNLITFDMGDSKCEPDENTQQFSWRLTDQRSLLILTAEGAPFELLIIEAADNRLVLENRANRSLIVRESYIPLDLGPEPPSSQGPLAPLRPSRPAPQTSDADNQDRQRAAD